MKPKVLIFASGSPTSGGSGFEKLVRASRGGALNAEIVAVVSNYEKGGVRTRAEMLGIPFVHFAKPWDDQAYQRIAEESKADFFALSGWLKLVTGLDPKTRFNSQKVINIHPGQLPHFGGTGMYGHHVHEAVLSAFNRGEVAHSAVTMHFVTSGYDRGPVFFQCPVSISKNDTADILGNRVNQQEHVYQPIITDLIVNGLITWDGIHPDSLQLPSGYSMVGKELNIHTDVLCRRCSHKTAACLECRGGHLMTMRCLQCYDVFSIDGE